MGAVHHRGVVSDVTREHRWTERIGPAQVISFLIGVFFAVNGLIGVIRAGLNDLPGERTAVLGLSMTALLALIHVAFGLIALTGVGSDLVARSSMGFLGTLAIIAGIVALAEPVQAMGWTDTNGIVYLITGMLALVSMFFAHRIVREDRVVAGEDRVIADDRHVV